MDLDECVLISDATLIVLAAQCPQLRSLSFSHCELITDEGIRHLGSSPSAKQNLSLLELDNCPLITDNSLDHLVGCRNLKRIELWAGDDSEHIFIPCIAGMIARQSPGLGSGSSVLGFPTSWFTLTLHLPPLPTILWGVVDQDTALVAQSSRAQRLPLLPIHILSYCLSFYLCTTYPSNQTACPSELSASSQLPFQPQFSCPTHSPNSIWHLILLPLLFTALPLLLLIHCHILVMFCVHVDT